MRYTSAIAPRAHPRRCGEHLRHDLDYGDTTGSSPQVRGTLLETGTQILPSGLIPAGAGNISAADTRGSARRAHPRRCGEHWARTSRTGGTGGSSPQVRGTCTTEPESGLLLGLIPAGAGNMSPPGDSSPCTEAHPRRCGEHSDLQQHAVRSNGLIPAGAGNIGTAASGTFRRMGSSPQVRGTSTEGRPSKCAWGLIPAGAGNITNHQPERTTKWAHPRRCGEHWRRTGSIGGTARLIPAGAGNIRGCRSWGALLGAHPRRCGEHAQRVGSRPGSIGLIPAGAGNMIS